ncbi:hypothetical protein NUW54_g2746 [Trametes sanguinea]|uniref:Uncharacterized protein n=1 Tax=Trametes sanguinea TaxID=158606 RepID=A0ACC1Q4Z1_9APHY|nr:hypothetical protein NUW54_g2746 [Trametes sanguinea]
MSSQHIFACDHLVRASIRTASRLTYATGTIDGSHPDTTEMPRKCHDGRAKLRAQYKQERKGAIRELRKDARFLAAEQQKKQKEKDREYNERMKRVFSSLESERAEEKAMEREKMKDKRRAGRK